jgi:chaperone modulatory protein CbpM
VKSLEEVLTELGPLSRAEVTAWIEARWVRPDPAGDGPGFRPVDVARLRLIRELRHELAIDEEAMPVVLSLLDEVYGLRRQLLALARALGEAPVELRTSVLTRCCAYLRERNGEEGDGLGPGRKDSPVGHNEKRESS